MFDNGPTSMKRTFVFILAGLAAAALLAGLVYSVLLVTQVSDPAAVTVQGATPRRIWATASAVLGLVGVVIGGLALRTSVAHIGPGKGRKAAIVALVAGLIAAVNGGLNLAVATGGLGSGNGVVGGAAALVLGVISMALGWLALARARRSS
jgi:hypothetical protein